MSWASDYIGIPWEAGAQGPYKYDCLGFFRMVQEKHFNRTVPQIIAADYDDDACIVGLFSTHNERLNWEPTETRTHGDAVIVHRPMHVGTWLDVDGGGILHCVRGIGVIFTHDSAWRVSGFGRREFFGHI